MSRTKTLICCLGILFWSQGASGETGLRGIVIDAENKTPLDGVLVYLDGKLASGPTGEVGRFTVDAAVPAEGTIRLVRIGYESCEYRVTSHADNVLRHFEMRRHPIDLAPVSVVAGGGNGRQSRFLQLDNSTISRREIRNEIGAGGDVLRSFQTLPSVAVPNDFSSQLFIRGGGPEQNAVLLDGVLLYAPYRAFGAMSVFNPLLIERATLYPGGFPARWGDRLSGVLDVRYRQGRSDRVSRDVSSDAITTRMLIEGPLDKSGTSFLLAGRRTHYDLVLDAASSDDNAYPHFLDLYAKIAGAGVGGRRWEVFGFGGREGMDVQRAADPNDLRSFDATAISQGGNAGFGFNVRQVRSLQTMDAYNASYVTDDWDFALGGDISANMNLKRQHASIGATWTRRVQQGLTLESGLELRWLRTRLEYDSEDLQDPYNEERAPDGADPKPPLNAFTYRHRTLQTGGYVSADWQVAKLLRLRPGVRLDGRRIAMQSFVPASGPVAEDVNRDAVSADYVWSPRLTAILPVADEWKVQASYGYYYQFPSLEAFTEKYYYPDLAANPGLRPEKARHFVLGVERCASDGGRVAMNVYHKLLSDVIVEASDGSYDPVNAGTITARGLELDGLWPNAIVRPGSVKLSYVLSVARLQKPADTYYLRHDRRHTLNLETDMELGLGWSVGSHFRWATGSRYTDVVGRHPGELSPETTPWLPVWGTTNGATFPAYRRLDVRITREFRWSNSRWEVFVEVLNLLNSRNVFQYSWDRQYESRSAMYQLPRLPNVGVSVSF